MNALTVLGALGLGLGLGVVTGIPPGVINLAIVDAAAAGRRWFASGLGLGGGTADTVHAALAFAGIGRLATAHPALVRGLAIGAAATIVAYSVVTWRRRHTAAPRMPDGRREEAEGGAPAGSAGGAAGRASREIATVQLGRGAATGLVLTLPNPAALGAWVAVASAVWPRATLPEAALIAGGVGVGSAVWFVLLARAIGRVRRDHPALAVIPRVALLLLVAIALAGAARAL